MSISTCAEMESYTTLTKPHKCFSLAIRTFPCPLPKQFLSCSSDNYYPREKKSLPVNKTIGPIQSMRF